MPTIRALATSLLPPGHGFQLRDVSIGPDQIIATLETTVVFVNPEWPTLIAGSGPPPGIVLTARLAVCRQVA